MYRFCAFHISQNKYKGITLKYTPLDAHSTRQCSIERDGIYEILCAYKIWNHICLVVRHKMKICRLVSVSFLHKAHHPRPMFPLLCRLSCISILSFQTNQVNRMIFRGALHLHIFQNQDGDVKLSFLHIKYRYVSTTTTKFLSIIPLQVCWLPCSE